MNQSLLATTASSCSRPIPCHTSRTVRRLPFTASQVPPHHTTKQHPLRQSSCICRSFEPNSPDELERDSPTARPSLIKAASGPLSKVNASYLVITGGMSLLLLFKNPYIYAALTIATIIPQNSNVTSLNTLVVWFYDSGLFMNFAEAVNCVRLVTWLSIVLCLVSFALFA